MSSGFLSLVVELSEEQLCEKGPDSANVPDVELRRRIGDQLGSEEQLRQHLASPLKVASTH
jgi:hypothetical protein